MKRMNWIASSLHFDKEIRFSRMRMLYGGFVMDAKDETLMLNNKTPLQHDYLCYLVLGGVEETTRIHSVRGGVLVAVDLVI